MPREIELLFPGHTTMPGQNQYPKVKISSNLFQLGFGGGGGAVSRDGGWI